MRIGFIVFNLLFFWSFSAYSQANVKLTGNVIGASATQKVEVTVNEKYLNGDITSYTGTLDQNGGFSFDLNIKEPQLVSLRYNQKRALIFLQPDTDLHVEANAASFPTGMYFGGESGKDNTYLASYYQKFPPELNQFKMKQYQTGDYWYINTPQMDKLMLNNPTASFRSKMDERKNKAQQNIDIHVEHHPDALSRGFVEFINTEILYDWAYHLMLYGVVFKNKYGITDSYFDFLMETPININSIGNYWYREFLKGFFEYKFIQNGGQGIAVLEKYNLANDYLTEKALYYFQSEMIAKGFRSNEPLNMVGKYFDFSEQNPYAHFTDKAAANFETAVKFAEGSPAPNFSLLDAGGSMVDLENMKGNVVYLNFWASWCRPCIKKMQSLKTIQPSLENEGVKFVNISLDKNKENWADALNRHNLNNSGIHLFANNDINAGVASDYGVKILPQYYIVNKDGVFATKPKEKDMLSIQRRLDQLNRQN